ncbi:unnamed protein product [Vitrella brassicaformis CCMP3155]|uniref:Uncharacterized protein n=1 Tax=Vitrella brassicaformis (strain CCMP3155) TaxID=1169540 RepID=A0A0G4F9S0_VITBC|nr:unnamed protein product [Vitrella brassicaformis CCMP3155]|eukprot:CEM09130.1 unnamed protein product [Vitrella brassicaformis CCMP3155]
MVCALAVAAPLFFLCVTGAIVICCEAVESGRVDEFFGSLFLRRVSDKQTKVVELIQKHLWGGLLVLFGFRKRISRMDYLLRMTHFVEEGGPWERCLQLLHLLKNCGHLPSLPVIITPDDVRQVGTKMEFDSQPAAMRQLSLFRSRADDAGTPSIFSKSIKARDRQALTEAFKRVLTPDMLPGDLLTVNTSDPPVIYERDEAASSSDTAASFTDFCLHVIFRGIEGINNRSRRIKPDEIMTRTAQQQLTERLGKLTSQMGPTWSGSRLAYVWKSCSPEWGWCSTTAVVCGDKATDEFAAFMNVNVYHQPSHTSNLSIVTTEPRVPRQRSAAQRFPRTAALIRAKVDAMEAE